jgi:hypothetical protein
MVKMCEEPDFSAEPVEGASGVVLIRPSRIAQVRDSTILCVIPA